MADSIRSCSACGAKRPKHELYRFIWGDEWPTSDPDGHASGRGAYCCRDEACLYRFMNQKKKWKRIFRL